MNDFLARLKRHHIFRVASVYAIVAWILIQVANGVFPDIGLTRADVSFVIAGVALLFPVVLVVGWMFIPPSKENSDKFSHWQHLRFRVGSVLALIIVVLVIFSGVFLWRANVRYMKAAAVAAAVASEPKSVISAAPSAATVIPAKSIAVLPFANLSGDPKQVYFSDGITEEILYALAQIPDLKVAGRTSAFQFKTKNEDLRKVGEILGVATVLEGSVQKAGDEVRITVQLVDTRSGYQMWSENYDRKLTNIFAIEDDISNAIAGKLRVQWSGGTSRPLVAQQTIDPRAHDFYLRGLALLAARGPGLRDAVAAFQSAVKIAPDYAQAWGALAEAEMILPEYQSDVSIGVAYARAKVAAERALAIDPNIASAYVALSVVYRNQWAKRDQAMQRALQLAPSNAEVVFQYAYFLLITGNLNAALREMDHALGLNPLSPIIAAERAETLLYMYRYDDALRQADATIAAHPDFPVTYGYAVMAAVQLHRYAEAATYAKRAAPIQDFALAFGVDAASLLQFIRGISDPTQRHVALRAVDDSDSDDYGKAEWYCALGAKVQALDALERGLDSEANPDIAAEEIWSPMLNPIRNDPRFKAVLKKMGLPYTPKNLSLVQAN